MLPTYLARWQLLTLELYRGFVLCSPKRVVHNVKAFEAQIRILELKSILSAGFNCVIHVHAAIEEVTFATLLHKLQKGTNRKSKVPPTHAKKGDSIIARMEVIGGAGSVCVETFEDAPQLGRFTLRDQVSSFIILIMIKYICTNLVTYRDKLSPLARSLSSLQTSLLKFPWYK
jgi:peptide chain release factor subunit 3